MAAARRWRWVPAEGEAAREHRRLGGSGPPVGGAGGGGEEKAMQRQSQLAWWRLSAAAEVSLEPEAAGHCSSSLQDASAMGSWEVA